MIFLKKCRIGKKEKYIVGGYIKNGLISFEANGNEYLKDLSRLEIIVSMLSSLCDQ